MAKKAVASLQSKSKRLTKAIKMVKSPKTGIELKKFNPILKKMTVHKEIK